VSSSHSPDPDPAHENGKGVGVGVAAAADGMTAHGDHAESHVPVHAVRGTGKGILVGVLLLGAVLGLTFFTVTRHRTTLENSLKQQTENALDTPSAVNVVPVRYGSRSRSISLPGETQGWYEATVYARVNGYVQQWNVDIGDSVKAGQVLAVIETPELDQQLAAAKAKAVAAQAQINLAKASMHFSQVTLDRYKDAPKGVVSDLERDERASDYQTSIARVAAAEADLNSANAEVERLDALINFQKVVAPFDGVITERRVDIGDLISAGSSSSTTALFRMAQYKKIRVFVNVPQSIAMEIHDGDDAAAVWNGEPFKGKVARNARALNPAARTLRMEVDVPNADLTLLPGMYLDVSFDVQDAKPALQIPASALNFRSGGPSVAVVSEDGRVSFRSVQIARDMGNIVEIAGGLSPDDRVVLNISNQIVDGDRVTATEIDNAPGGSTPATQPGKAVATVTEK
jgi:RND family efflux transporter MFP subunit